MPIATCVIPIKDKILSFSSAKDPNVSHYTFRREDSTYQQNLIVGKDLLFKGLCPWSIFISSFTEKSMQIALQVFHLIFQNILICLETNLRTYDEGGSCSLFRNAR